MSEKKLCKILGKKDIPGRPILYGTTDEFLSLFSLKNLSSLPTIREFKELTEKHNEKVNDLFEQPTMEELKSDVSEIQRFSETDDENIAEIDQALSESRKVKTVEKILAHEIMQDPPEEGEEGAEGAEESESLENSEHTDEGLKAQDGAENEEETAEETLQESTEELTPDYEALNEDDEELHETEIEREDVVEAYTAPIENNDDAQSMSDDPGTEDSDEVSDSDLYDKETLDSIEKTFEDEEDPQEDEMLAENVESAQETDETTDEPEITG